MPKSRPGASATMHDSKDPKMLRTPSEVKLVKARKILGEINSGLGG